MNFENIPLELKERDQWVLWRDKKVPYQTNGKKASTTDSTTWSSFKDVSNCYDNTNEYDGIGFVFSDTDEYCGIDIDNVRDSESGEWEPEVLEEIKNFGSYAELSPSGTGAHVICIGEVPGDSHRKGNYEIYDSGRYFTFTGEHIEGTPNNVKPAQKAINKYCRKHIEKSDGFHHEVTKDVSKSPALSDEEILDLCKKAKNNDKFNSLWAGSIKEYKSESEADLALCAIFSFYTQDHTQIDRLFRQSGLCRDKWTTRAGYREDTIKTAIDGLTEVYTPSNRNNKVNLDEDIEVASMEDMAKMAERNHDIRLSLDLPDDHYISMFKGWMGSLTDGYSEYAILAALTNLSAVVQGKVRLRLKHETVIPNLFVQLLGTSTVSRKSTVVNKARRIYEAATEKNIPNKDYSIEGLIEDLAQYPVSYFVRDESGGQMAKDTKKYNGGIVDFWCSMYDGQNYTKTLAAGRQKNPRTFSISGPYVTRLLATTPDNFFRYVSIDDFLAGLGYRFLYAFPTYKKERRPIAKETAEDTERWGAVMLKTKELFNHFANSDVMEFDITDEALEYYNLVVDTLEEQAEQSNDEMLSSAIGRSQIHILKIAMLLEIGKAEMSSVVTLESVRIASKMIVEYFIPTVLVVINRLHEDAKNNKLEKIVSTLRRLGGYASHTKLLHDSKLLAREFKECIETLVESGTIEVRQEKNSRKKYYILKENPKGGGLKNLKNPPNHRVSTTEKREEISETSNNLTQYEEENVDTQRRQSNNCSNLKNPPPIITVGESEISETSEISENCNVPSSCVGCGTVFDATKGMNKSVNPDGSIVYHCDECYNTYFLKHGTKTNIEDVERIGKLMFKHASSEKYKGVVNPSGLRDFVLEFKARYNGETKGYNCKDLEDIASELFCPTKKMKTDSVGERGDGSNILDKSHFVEGEWSDTACF